MIAAGSGSVMIAEEDPVTTTPLWVPLLIAGLGLLSAVLGAVITQRRADHRERLQWEQMRDREREQWDREDSLRTFDQRSNCYVDFEAQLRSTAVAVSDARSGIGAVLEDDWQSSTFQSLLRLQVFATPETTAAALAAYDSLLRWGDASDEDSYHFEAAYDKAHEQYLSAIRKDLRIDMRRSNPDQSK